jgi:hypothetical protein
MRFAGVIGALGGTSLFSFFLSHAHTPIRS